MFMVQCEMTITGVFSGFEMASVIVLAIKLNS
jgi:hypothetical protein